MLDCPLDQVKSWNINKIYFCLIKCVLWLAPIYLQIILYVEL